MKHYCFKCKEKEITDVARGLCNRCYVTSRYKNLINGLPMRLTKNQKRRGTIIRTRDKYGIEFLKDINAVDHKQFFNLSDIARKYNVSRERIRQLYTKIKDRPFQEISILKTANRDDELSCPHDPRHKAAEYIKDSNIGKAAIVEKKFYEECADRSFDISFCKNGNVDLIVNGLFVDVKSAFVSACLTKGAKTRYFRYVGRGEQVKIAHFFACYHLRRKTFFIIPNNIIPKDKNNISTIYIQEIKSKYHNSKNKYWEYENRWDLLEYRSIVDFY